MSDQQFENKAHSFLFSGDGKLAQGLRLKSVGAGLAGSVVEEDSGLSLFQQDAPNQDLRKLSGNRRLSSSEASVTDANLGSSTTDSVFADYLFDRDGDEPSRNSEDAENILSLSATGTSNWFQRKLLRQLGSRETITAARAQVGLAPALVADEGGDIFASPSVINKLYAP